MDRIRLVESLRRLSSTRNAIAGEVEIKNLWEILNQEKEWIDLKLMTGLCFPNEIDEDHEAGVIRAIFNGRRYFRFKPDRFLALSEAEIDEIIEREKKIAHQAQLIQDGAKWLLSAQPNSKDELPECHEEIMEAFTSYYLKEKDSPQYQMVRAMMKEAGLTANEDIFQHLVKMGKWTPDENIDLLRFNISIEFPQPVLNLAQSLSFTSIAGDRVDLTHLDTITIDGQATLDFDDALSIETRKDHFLVGIHISDVAEYVRKNDRLDKEARSRGSSIYMPDNRISMTPPILAENRFSLKKDHVRPTISTMVKISRTGDIISYDVFPSLIRVNQQLSYFEANVGAEEGQPISVLFDIASRFRKMRLGQGAIQITLPEINIWLDETGTPIVSRVNRESPGRMLVAEMMILANWLCARLLAENDTPAIFRSQPKPKARILKNGTGTLFQNWMQRKLLNRFVLRAKPAKHCGLGLDAYVTATSPIRKYFDLVTQRQIRSVLGLEKAYTEQEIEEIIGQLAQPMADVGRIQFRRNRYWLLKHLEGRIGKKEEAIVLRRRNNAYSVLLTAYMLECALPQSSGIELKPEDLVQVTIQHVNARNNTLSVFMG